MFNKKSVVLVFLFIILLSSIYLVNAGSCKVPESGDWIIDTKCSISEGTHILNGDLTITSEGSLILENVVLLISGDQDGQRIILVDGGSLNVVNSEISALNPENAYRFNVEDGSEFTVENSFIKNIGYGESPKDLGLWIAADDVLIKNSEITCAEETCSGLVFEDSSDSEVKNSIVRGKKGIYLEDSDGTEIVNSVIISSLESFYIKGSGDYLALNTTFNKSQVYFVGKDSGNKREVKPISSSLEVKWYVDAIAFDGDDLPLEGTTIEAYANKSNLPVFSAITDDEGTIPQKILTEYVQSPTGSDYYTPYLFKASKEGYIPNDGVDLVNHSVDLTFFVFPPSYASNASLHDQLIEGFKYLPRENFPEGILRDVGSFLFTEDIANSTGEFPLVEKDYFFTDEYVDTYGDLLRSYITESSQIPDFQNHTNSNAGDSVQTLVEHGNIQTLSLAVVKYNYLDPLALEKGTLKLIFANGSEVPKDFDFFDTSSQRYYSETEKSTQGYVESSTFVGTSFMREDVFLDSDSMMRFTLPSTFLVAKGVGNISDISIRFVGFPQSGFPESEFLPINTDQIYLINFSSAFPESTNGSNVSTIPIHFIINFTIDQGPPMYVGSIFGLLDKPKPQHCSQIVHTARYPSCRPEWWPEDEWDNLPLNPLDFFTQDPADEPVWWPSFMPWPVNYGWYSGFTSYCFDAGTGPGSHKYLPSKYLTVPTNNSQNFGRFTYITDQTIWGPTYDSSTGAVGNPGHGGTNWAGGINWRLYPATHRANDPNRCKAENLVVVVDGIDITNTRSASTIYEDFKPALQQMLDKGYDVLILDYVDGRDYIQRNGLVLAEVFKKIPTFMKPGYETHDAIVLAGSMGTQTSRYGLAKLEEQGIDHHVGLWLALDGPFVGAHVPWSIQGMTDFFADFKDAAKPNSEGLHSPAARQLLRHHTDFVPDFIHHSFYAEVDALNGGTGLPQKLRKVAVSSGSGAGFSALGHQQGDNPLINNDYVFDTVLISLGPIFGLDIEAWTEKYSCGGVGQWVFHGKRHNPVFSTNWKWDTCQGMTKEDVSPAGYRTSGKDAADAFNENDPPVNMTSQIENHSFIPLFSSLYLKGADDYTSKMNVKIKKKVTIYIAPSFYSVESTQPTTDYWYGPEDPAKFPYFMDPNIEKSPFDAIWYQSNNQQHVVDAGVLPLKSEEAFLFEEMDRFTSQEMFNAQSVANGNKSLKIPSRDVVLFGDLTGCNEQELLTVNTFKKKAMIQRWSSQGWATLWQGNGSIGNWSINKGDRFFLADVIGSTKKEVVFMDANVPARVLVQNFSKEECTTLTGVGNVSYQPHIYLLSDPPQPGSIQLLSVATWKPVWDNNGNGKIGPWTIRVTDMYSFGRPDAANPKEELLVAYPYIGNDVREKVQPGAGGRSRAELLKFTGSGWSSVWNDYGGGPNQRLHFMGEVWPIRFGDYMGFGRTMANETDKIFTVNFLRDIFGGSIMMQEHNPTAYNGWNPVWSTGGSQQTHFGNWYLGNPEDMFYFGDLDGDGVDEIFSANSEWAHIHKYDDPAFDWTWMWGTGPYDNSTIASYKMSTGDRFAIGNINNESRHELLAYNPEKFGPVKLMHFNTNSSWSVLWQDNGSRKIGDWQMYQDRIF